MRANIVYGLSTLAVMMQWKLHQGGVWRNKLFVS
jgi:hypothetical protein